MSSSILSRRSIVARAGFTIVELLVATAITLVVLGLMVQISFSVLGTFDKVTGTVTARTQASTVLRFLREDF
jgi:prepilin-type N-terminal cleavage/methylation domain-containing protein